MSERWKLPKRIVIQAASNVLRDTLWHDRPFSNICEDITNEMFKKEFPEDDVTDDDYDKYEESRERAVAAVGEEAHNIYIWGTQERIRITELEEKWEREEQERDAAADDSTKPGKKK